MKVILSIMTMIVASSTISAAITQSSGNASAMSRVEVNSLPCDGVEISFSAFQLPWGKREALRIHVRILITVAS